MDGQVPEPGLDRRLALSRVGGDAELLREIAHVFLEDYPRSLIAIRAAIAAADAKQLEISAHSLKGSVANFGAREAVEAALRLERMGHDREMRESAESLLALERALAALHTELEAL